MDSLRAGPGDAAARLAVPLVGVRIVPTQPRSTSSVHTVSAFSILGRSGQISSPITQQSWGAQVPSARAERHGAVHLGS
eukprot:4866540-Pyramimonas_sp.AAC.1